MGAGGLPSPAPTLPRAGRSPVEAAEETQQSRILAAVPAAVARHGYGSLTVEHLIGEASVSRTTFYAHFSDKRECVRIAHGRTFDSLSAAIYRVCVAQREWPWKLDASIRAAVAFAADSPDRARLLLCETLGADLMLSAQVRASTEHLVRLLRAGREQSAMAEELPETLERSLVGAAVSTIGSRLLQGEADRLPALAPELIHLMLIPYVGPEEARRLATSPA